MFTASHNPAEYNGIKLVERAPRQWARTRGSPIKQMIRSGVPESDETMGEARSRDTLADYAGYLRELVDLSNIRPSRSSWTRGTEWPVTPCLRFW